MKLVSSANFRFCTTKPHTTTTTTTKQIKTLARTLNKYDSRIKRNNKKMVSLTQEINHTCKLNEDFVSQKQCQELYLNIEDISDENRRLNLLKREIYLRHGLEWDEEYN